MDKSKYRENLEARAKLLLNCKNNTKNQELVKEKCRRDILFFFENFLYTDKNSAFFWADIPYNVPFVLFDFQKEFVLDLWDSILEWQKPISERKNPTDTFIEKSRQMWLSWLICSVFLYWYMFHNLKFLMISQKQDDVDKNGDMKSLFEKIRFQINYLPKWILPPWLTKDSGTEYNKFCSVSRSDWSWSITWESANPNASRWGTYAAILMDEMATMANAAQINTAASRATPCRIFNSTPNGKGNEYFRMRQLAETWAFRRHRIHWSEHPYYTKEWYDAQCKWMTKEQIAQELDIEYNASVIWRVYPEFKDNTYPVEYNEHLPVYIWIDNSHWWTDPHAIIVCQPDWHYRNVIDYLEVNCSVTDIAQMLWRQPKMIMDDVTLNFYNRYLTYKPAIFVSDPYDTHSTLNTTTIFEEYQKSWIFLNTQITKDKKEQIQKTKANIYRYKINPRAIDLVNAIANSRYPEVKENSNRTTPADIPVHNQFSHGRSALEYLTCFLLENDKLSVERPKTKIEVKNHLTGNIETKYI